MNSPGAARVEASAREQGEFAAENVMHNAQLQAYGYRTQATNFMAQSQLDRMQAHSAETGGILGAAGSLLSGASSLGLKWSGLNGLGGSSTLGAGDLPGIDPFPNGTFADTGGTPMNAQGFAIGGT